MQEVLLQALFSPPRCGASPALARLPAGRLWKTFLPGASPGAALAALGEDGAATLSASLSALPDLDAHVAATGFPFAWDGTPAELAHALLHDALRTTSRPSRAATGTARIEVRHAPRADWEAAVLACLDHAAREAVDGRLPDPLDALLVAPGVDLRAVAGIADADARIRFAAGMAGMSADSQCFGLSYFRRSVAAGILGVIAAELEGFPAVARGRTACGWPAWCEVCGIDDAAALAAVPPAVAAGPFA